MGSVCHEPEIETVPPDVEDSTKSREFGTTDKICHSTCLGYYTPEADEPHGENEGSTTVEAESLDENELPEKFDPTGWEAIGDCCHHNLYS